MRNIELYACKESSQSKAVTVVNFIPVRCSGSP